MIINVKRIIKVIRFKDVFNTSGIGRISVISTSKIKKITAIKKNRRENGMRAGSLGSNPHSNGDGFSRSWIFFFAIEELSIINAIDRKRARKNIHNIIFIL